MSLAAFTQYFDQIQDPRQATKVTYTLFDVLFLAVAAVIGGSQGWEEIEDFGHFSTINLKSRLTVSGLITQTFP